MKIIDIQQGTPEWHAWRKGKLSASKAPKILGICPYQTALELWEEEVGLREEQPTSPNMQKGLDIENEAREWFLNETGFLVVPRNVCHCKNDIFIASLDGLDLDNKIILEIKHVKNEYHEMARAGKIPDHYIVQVQHQMHITEYDKAYYLSWRHGDPILIIVKRDEEFIQRMIEREISFYQMVQDLTPPPLTDRDYMDMSYDHVLKEMMEDYKLDEAFFKKMQKSLESKKSDIIRHIGERNAKGSDWKMTRYAIKGRVDYERIEELKDVDLDKYRRPSTFGYRLTIGI